MTAMPINALTLNKNHAASATCLATTANGMSETAANGG